MKEIEVKILEINKTQIERKLKSLGAKKVFDGDVYAIYFKNKNNTIRLRKKGNKSYLTVKLKLRSKKAKVREEHEIEVSDFEITKKILELLGLKKYINQKKHRTSYKIKDTIFEIDKYSGKYSRIPAFLEIEGKKVNEIYKYAKLLGFKEEQCKPWTGKDLIEYYL